MKPRRIAIAVLIFTLAFSFGTIIHVVATDASGFFGSDNAAPQGHGC